MHKPNQARAFTLIEAAVTLTIVGVLAAASNYGHQWVQQSQAQVQATVVARSINGDVQTAAITRNITSEQALQFTPWATNPATAGYAVTVAASALEVTHPDGAVVCLRYSGTGTGAPGLITNGSCAGGEL